MSPELWIECKVPCEDCPLDTHRSAKKECAHLWRRLVDEELSKSGDGTVPADTIKRAVLLGASVTGQEQHGRGPSIQETTVEPPQRHRYQTAKIDQN